MVRDDHTEQNIKTQKPCVRKGDRKAKQTSVRGSFSSTESARVVRAAGTRSVEGKLKKQEGASFLRASDFLEEKCVIWTKGIYLNKGNRIELAV